MKKILYCIDCEQEVEIETFIYALGTRYRCSCDCTKEDFLVLQTSQRQ